jgi:two-component SAPR family response regulator
MQEPPLRILILEDDQELRNVLHTVLSAEGYDVTTACGGQEAVDQARQSAFDVVVADIRMEGMDGLQALESIQAEQPEVRSLVVTGYSTEADSIRAIRLGVSDYLTKPFRLDNFLDAIHAIVAKRRIELQRAQEQQRLQSTLVWAAQRIAAYVDREDPSQPALAQLPAEVERLGRSLGWPRERWERAQLAALLAALRITEVAEGSGQEVADRSGAGGAAAGVAGAGGAAADRHFSGRALPSIPPAVARILRHYDERWDGQGGPDGLQGEEIPLESRLVAALLASREGPLAAQASADPGRFDPQLVALLSGSSQETSALPVPDMAPEQVRGLLSLARALLEAGQAAEAEQALQAVVETRTPSREKVEALILLARGAAAAAQPELVARAVAEADALGPWTVAWAGLNGGLLLRQSQAQSARSYLTAAGKGYQQMGHATGQALALLGLDWASRAVDGSRLESAVEVLLRPENRSTLVEAASWLLLYLLGQPCTHEAQVRLIHRTLYEAPRSAAKLLRQGALDASARGRAVEHLSGLGGEAAQKLLQGLAADSDPEVREAARQALRREQVEALRPLLRIYSMGPFEVYRGERRVHEDEWKTSKIKYLFALLSAGAGRPVVQDKILDLFWPDDLEKGTKSLYWSTSVLRRVLRAEQKEEVVARSRDSLLLNPDVPRWHDVEELSRLTRQGRAALQSGQAVALGAFRPLLDLYRGPYLEGYYADWAEGTRTRLAMEAGQLLLGLAEHARAEGHLESALEFAGRLVEVDPYHSEGHMVAMQTMAGMGRHDQLIRHYEAMERRLRQEMDMEPTIAMLELYHRAKLSL